MHLATTRYFPLRGKAVAWLASLVAATLLLFAADFATAAAQDGVWTSLGPPEGRAYHSAVFDPNRHRMLSFGGYNGIRLNSVWELALDGVPRWRSIENTGTPPSARTGHAAIYDPIGDRMIVFAGDNGADALNDVWQLSFTGAPAWTQLSPNGVAPPRRDYTMGVYDPIRHRMIIFGGNVVGVGRSNDVWALSLDGSLTWEQLTPTGAPPEPRYGFTMTYDSDHDQVVVFGGSGSSYLNDVWTLSLSGTPAWSQVIPTGVGPSPRYLCSAVYDSASQRLLVFGGTSNLGASKEVWSLPLDGPQAWTDLTPASGGPAPCWGNTLVFDPIDHRMLAHAGSSIQGEVWGFDLSGSAAWSYVVGPGPPNRYSVAAVHDPLRDRMWIFGGLYPYRNDVWHFDLSGNSGWSEVIPVGSAPLPRAEHTAIYDSHADRIIVYGGYASGTNFGDVWALSLTEPPTWTQLVPIGPAPAARYGHSAIYDWKRHRMIVFGGRVNFSNTNEVWALSLVGDPVWTQITGAGTAPPPMIDHSAVFDATRDRMVVFENQVWLLSLGETPTWTQRPFGFESYAHTAIIDPVRDRMVVFGGGLYDAPGFNKLPNAYSLATNNWTTLSPSGSSPNSGDDLAAIYDNKRERLIVTGFGNGGTWALNWVGPTAVMPQLQPVHPTLLAAPNPSRARVALTMTLGSAGHVRLDVFDLAGRRIRTLVDGPIASGRHTVQWDRRNSNGAPVPAGIYLVKLVSLSESISNRIAILE